MEKVTVLLVLTLKTEFPGCLEILLGLKDFKVVLNCTRLKSLSVNGGTFQD